MFSPVLRAFTLAVPVVALCAAAQTSIYSNVRLISDIQEPFAQYCLAADSNADGAAAVVVPCSDIGSSDVNWSIPEPVNDVFTGSITTTDGKLCLTVPAGVVGSGVQLAVKACTVEEDQQWQSSGNAQWKVLDDTEAFCITIPNAESGIISNPTVVELEECVAGSRAQRFTISFN